MVKHFELTKFIEKMVFFCHFLNFLAKYPPLWISKFKKFCKKFFLRTPPNRRYSLMNKNKIIIKNQIISLSLEYRQKLTKTGTKLAPGEFSGGLLMEFEKKIFLIFLS